MYKQSNYNVEHGHCTQEVCANLLPAFEEKSGNQQSDRISTFSRVEITLGCNRFYCEIEYLDMEVSLAGNRYAINIANYRLPATNIFRSCSSQNNFSSLHITDFRLNAFSTF